MIMIFLKENLNLKSISEFFVSMWNEAVSNEFIKKLHPGTSLEVQWLRLQACNAGGPGSIPGQGTKILHTSTKTWCSQINIEEKKSYIMLRISQLSMHTVEGSVEPVPQETRQGWWVNQGSNALKFGHCSQKTSGVVAC